MIDVFWQRLDIGARLAVPFATTLLFTFLGVVVWPLPYLGAVAPPLGWMALYYWAIHRPDLLRPGMVFVIGLINDVINFLPLGFSALLFVAAHQVLLRQRRFFAGHSFLMTWFGFMLTILIALTAQWGFLCLARWQWVPFMPVLTQCLLAILIFPVPCWLLIRLQRAALSQN